MILFFTLSSGLILLLLFGFNYRYSRIMMEKKMEENAQNLAQAKVNSIESLLLAVQKVPENLACFLENGVYNREELRRLLSALVEKNGEIYGAAVAFEPYGFDKKTLHYAPYYYRTGGVIKFTDLGQGAYGYTHGDWYQIPKEINRPDWSEPYYDEGGGNILMATYAVPFYRKVDGQRRFMGIVTADVNLEKLQEVVSSIKVLQTGYGFLISRNGTILTHPAKELIMNETLFGVAEARKDVHLREIGRRMIKGESGLVPFRSLMTEEPCWMYYAPIPTNGWALAVLFPQKEFVADITRVSRMIILLGLVGLLLLSLAVAFIARSITRPLKAMAEATKTIATGNLDIALPPVTSGDEVGRLTESFQTMKESLKTYIAQLTETTASKERIESELKIAHDIQMSILPKLFPPFTDRPEFNIHALIEPAREVGGDFYDFFFVDEDHFCFVIGDVSGKGVPASLFMAVTKTLFKATTTKGMAPGEILTAVNRELGEGNASCMFVTIFCGILDIRTGEVTFANGGHNLPFLVYRHREATMLEANPGLVVGVMEDFVYETDKLRLEPGDAIFLYTDGLTEAMDKAGAFFSEERLAEQLAASKGKPAPQLLADIMAGIASFSQGAPQSDDITMMMIEFRASKK